MVDDKIEEKVEKSISPSTLEEKKAKIMIDKLLEKVKVQRELFKDDKAWNQYATQLKIFEAYAQGVLEQQIEREKLEARNRLRRKR